jgi:hypothetical protein
MVEEPSMKRICVNVSDEQAAALQRRNVETGVPQSEQIRRAINLALFADEQVGKKTTQHPVLFARQQETR